MTLKLHRLISDGCILQRDAAVAVCGTATPLCDVCVTFCGQSHHANADENGRWRVTLDPIPAGGPHTLTATSNGQAVTVRDILMGDLWFCGGQSNMELPMSRVAPRYPDEMRTANNNEIRHFYVERGCDFHAPHDDYDVGEWRSVSPDTLPAFFATSYFFAKTLYERYGVPVGLINCAVGGTIAEAWTSEATVRRFADASAELTLCQDDAHVSSTTKRDAMLCAEWMQSANAQDVGLRDGYQHADHPDWAGVNPTRNWSKLDSLRHNGVFWFEGDVWVDNPDASALLVLGTIRDSDTAYVNGVYVGETGYQYPPRRYPIPKGVLRHGKNRVTVRVVSQNGHGAFVAGKRYGIEFDDSFSAIEAWRMATGCVMDSPMHQPQRFENKPSGLFNAMLHPALSATIRGAIWYQGESNTANASEYRERFAAMLSDLRARWGDIPFITTQISNYDFNNMLPAGTETGWARLRDEQRRCLELQNVGMAVTIDIGEANDLHPLNKSEVGRRLALCAFALAYGERVPYSGPLAERAVRDGSRVVVTFTHADGLHTRPPSADASQPMSSEAPPRTSEQLSTLVLSVAAPGGEFRDTHARLEGDRLIIDDAPCAATLRYMWVNSPTSALLYNAAGLPASPFQLAVE